MKTEHTPGPWDVRYYDNNGQAVVSAEHIEIATCWHHCVGSIEKEMHANARLIAAAPDLLVALQDVDALWMHHSIAHGDGKISPLHEQVIAAIAKAKGIV